MLNAQLFAYGFAKSDPANLSEAQLTACRKASKIWLGLTQAEIDFELRTENLLEVHDDNEDV
jgi:hypothetical protein